jgi:hypothetical protein
MMTGTGPFGAVGMGGMFSVVKVRKDQKRGDYSDPGWYQHPPGTVEAGQPGARLDAAMVAKPAQDVEVKVRKPGGRPRAGHN